jgi:hypothetical protein
VGHHLVKVVLVLLDAQLIKNGNGLFDRFIWDVIFSFLELIPNVGWDCLLFKKKMSNKSYLDYTEGLCRNGD